MLLIIICEGYCWHRWLAFSLRTKEPEQINVMFDKWGLTLFSTQRITITWEVSTQVKKTKRELVPTSRKFVMAQAWTRNTSYSFIIHFRIFIYYWIDWSSFSQSIEISQNILYELENFGFYISSERSNPIGVSVKHMFTTRTLFISKVESECR